MVNHSYYKKLFRIPGKLQRNKQRSQEIYVGRSTTLHNLLLCAHTDLNYVTVTFLLVTSSGTNEDLLCLCRVIAKKANKNIEQRILPMSSIRRNISTQMDVVLVRDNHGGLIVSKPFYSDETLNTLDVFLGNSHFLQTHPKREQRQLQFLHALGDVGHSFFNADST